MKKILSITVLFLIVFTSCKKDNSSPSKLDLLTAGPWIMQKYEGKIPPSTVWTDYFNGWISDCDKDDKWIFSRDGGMELNESTIACSGSAPNSVKDVFNWTFTDNERKITIDGVIQDITQLDENSLVLSNTVTGGEFRVTYSH